MYKKNIKPGLTNENGRKQVEFSTFVHRRWDLPAGTKILWVMSDEKWWHGLVPRSNAKACVELGIYREAYSVHHKSHIAKVMGHATVGYLFDDHPENGGEGFLIGLHRAQAVKIAQRTQRFGKQDPVTKKWMYKDQPIKYNRGDCIMVDCCVTGSDQGTATNPKFPLKDLWKHALLPCLDELVAAGGPCAGAKVIFQEDNAGPHVEGDYRSWMMQEFKDRDWMVALQAPQGLI